MPENFGSVYDWMEDYTLPADYTNSNKEDLLRSIYDEMSIASKDPIDYESWKEDYGRYFEVYNPAQEKILQEKFDIKYEQTEKLFDLKTKQEERDYDLIEKYSSIDDSDDFESSTEMAIRHSNEQKAIDDKMARYKITSEGRSLHQKKKMVTDKSLLKNLRTGDSDAIVDELDRTFWDNMKVVRSEYDKQRLNKSQALESMILKSEQIVESAFKSKRDSLDTIFQTAETSMKNDAASLIGDKISMREDYDEELWEMAGELAASDAFEGRCATVVCGANEMCDPSNGKCIPDYATRKASCEGHSGEGTATWHEEPYSATGGYCAIDLTDRDNEGNMVQCDSDKDCGECTDCIGYKCVTDTACAKEKLCSDSKSGSTIPGDFSLGDGDPCGDDWECPCTYDPDTHQHRDCMGNLCQGYPNPFN